MIDEIKEADKLIEELDGITYEDVEELYTKATKTTGMMSNNVVQASVKGNSRENLLLALAELSKEYTDCLVKLKEIFNKIDDRDLKIYFEKKYLLNGYTPKEKNNILEYKYNLSRRQIQKICKKVEEFHKSSH